MESKSGIHAPIRRRSSAIASIQGQPLLNKQRRSLITLGGSLSQCHQLNFLESGAVDICVAKTLNGSEFFIVMLPGRTAENTILSIGNGVRADDGSSVHRLRLPANSSPLYYWICVQGLQNVCDLCHFWIVPLLIVVSVQLYSCVSSWWSTGLRPHDILRTQTISTQGCAKNVSLSSCFFLSFLL